ncbi:MAG TPA: preprotein translocase subunit YajC [Candidatus Omnitrophota bacterium]|nr:preprotein translocase subunit YajC [Candidatus Omnitrophota bacterium]HRZ15689.1 preprotein translocase subunit YajC [Candidatus Omnitrophota bacterium]
MPPQTTQVNPIFFISQFALIIGIFYFIVIRPQKQEQKKHQAMIKGLQKNDEVVTTGGIHGTIVNVKEQTVVIRVDDNVKIELEKNCVGIVKKQQSANEGKQ